VKIILAQSFARIFFRNAINVGLLPIVCPDTDRMKDGSEIIVKERDGKVVVDGKNLPSNRCRSSCTVSLRLPGLSAMHES
jgi:3-isopropylmalate/(R)-2-methylmalate dehydratase small subunit